MLRAVIIRVHFSSFAILGWLQRWPAVVVGILWSVVAMSQAVESKIFRAGAAIVDIMPTNYPVMVNGMFTKRSAIKTTDPLHVRAIALDDSSTRLVITVVDTSMVSRQLIDRAKVGETFRSALELPGDAVRGTAPRQDANGFAIRDRNAPQCESFAYARGVGAGVKPPKSCGPV